MGKSSQTERQSAHDEAHASDGQVDKQKSTTRLKIILEILITRLSIWIANNHVTDQDNVISAHA